jgi:hypothetical protein
MDRLPVSISGQTVVTKIHPQIQKTLKIKDFSFGHKNDHFGERRIPEINSFLKSSTFFRQIETFKRQAKTTFRQIETIERQ